MLTKILCFLFPSQRRLREDREMLADWLDATGAPGAVTLRGRIVRLQKREEAWRERDA